MTRRIMLDIETLSTHNTNAVVLSVGAVEWTMNKERVIFTSKCSWVLNLAEQFALGRTTMDSTIQWWAKQSDAARAHWLTTSPCNLRGFRDGLRSMFNGDKECEVWAKGIMFDLGNITSLYYAAGEDTPWHYRAPSDMRVLYRTHTIQRTRPADLLEGPEHDPVADCESQIWNVWEVYPATDLPNAPAPVMEASCEAEPIVDDQRALQSVGIGEEPRL